VEPNQTGVAAPSIPAPSAGQDTEQEIAVILNISPGTVKSRASRALQSMRPGLRRGEHV
jgi:hypothetical protein